MRGRLVRAPGNGQTRRGGAPQGLVVSFQTNQSVQNAYPNSAKWRAKGDCTVGKLSDRYPFPAPEGDVWHVPQNFDVVFNWDYADGRETMMGLYRKGVEMQWDAETRIDWSRSEERRVGKECR